MRTIEKTIYKYSELSESAQKKAREWFTAVGDHWDSEYTIEMAAEVADMFGLDIRQTLKTRMDKSHFYAPTVYFSGFWSQGDGACFDGTYKYKNGALAAVKKEWPKDTELHRIVALLQATQKKYFYALRARCTQSGHYMHSGCMRVEVEDSQDSYRDVGGAESDITQCLRDFADWIYRALETEYDYSSSDDAIADSMESNGYEFYKNGEIA